MEKDLREGVQEQDAALVAATRRPRITTMPEQAEDWEKEADQPVAEDREEVSNEEYRNSKIKFSSL